MWPIRRYSLIPHPTSPHEAALITQSHLHTSFPLSLLLLYPQSPNPRGPQSVDQWGASYMQAHDETLRGNVLYYGGQLFWPTIMALSLTI